MVETQAKDRKHKVYWIMDFTSQPTSGEKAPEQACNAMVCLGIGQLLFSSGHFLGLVEKLGAGIHSPPEAIGTNLDKLWQVG
jgi:hypothetical protein